MRQKPEVFYGRKVGTLEDFLENEFTKITLERADIDIEANVLWYMAQKGWLLFVDKPPQNSGGRKALWYSVNTEVVTNVAEAMKMYDAERRLLGSAK